MDEAAQSVSLLRFCAGSMYFAVAAEDVAAVAPARGDAVHIGAILGVDPAGDAGDRRMIYLAPVPGQAPADPVSFQADVPVDVIRCSADDILPMPPAMPRDPCKPVMGFARNAHQLIVLLDIPTVIAKLVDNAQGGTS